jgi:hypothetical protein
MERAPRTYVNRFLSCLLLAGSLMVAAAAGCGDDDDGSTGGAGNGGATGTAGSDAGESDPKQDTCQCYIDLGIVPQDDALKAECVSRVSDACVTCTQEVAAGGGCGDLTEADFNDCASDCNGIIAPPETAEECKHLIEIFGESPVDVSVTDCFCDNCLDVFAPCMVNRGCMSIVLCAGERNCDIAACLTDEVCQPVIINANTVYPDVLTTLMIPVSICNTTYNCRPTPTPTAGTGGAGGTAGEGGAGGTAGDGGTAVDGGADGG